MVTFISQTWSHKKILLKKYLVIDRSNLKYVDEKLGLQNISLQETSQLFIFCDNRSNMLEPDMLFVKSVCDQCCFAFCTDSNGC